MNPTHDSIRGWFAAALHDEMEKDERIWCLTGDLGFLMLDKIRDDFPERFLNLGASEQALIGAGVGLALSSKIPFCYSITTFLIYRPFEWHVNYLNHEEVPVRLIGSGIFDDYKHDGKTHQPYGLKELFRDQLWNISFYEPISKEEVPQLVKSMVGISRPAFMCLRR